MFMRKHGTVREEMGVDQGKKQEIKEVKEKERLNMTRFLALL